MKNVLKNKKLIIIAIVMIVFIGAFLSTYFIYDNKKDKVNEEIDVLTKQYERALKVYEENFEYGNTWSYDDFLNNLVDKDSLDNDTVIKIMVNGEEINSSDNYSFNSAGNVIINVSLENNYTYKIFSEETKNIKIEKVYELIVEDNNPPVIDGVSDQEITVGDTLDLKSLIKASDVVDGELEVVIEGNLDTNVAGEYNLKVIATDKNGNSVEKEFKVVVKEKPVVKPSNPTTSGNKNNGSSSSGNQTTVANDASTKAGRLNLAKAEAKRVVAEIIKPGMSDEEKAYAIYKYLHYNVDRQTNQSTEAYKTNFGNEAYAALIMKIAACSGFCKAVTLLCNEAGLQSQHINAGEWTHQWNKVLINGEWIILDAQGGLFGGTVHILETY